MAFLDGRGQTETETSGESLDTEVREVWLEARFHGMRLPSWCGTCHTSTNHDSLRLPWIVLNGYWTSHFTPNHQ